MSDDQLLDEHGFDLICESPLEIEHRETKSRADGMVAQMLIQMLRDGAVSFKE